MPHETDRQPVESPSPQHSPSGGQPVRSPATELPHLLLRAIEQLKSALKDGIDQFERKGNTSNAADVCSSIEWFVDDFYRFPIWEAELRRRAFFVEEQCKQGSSFRRTMDSFRKQFRSQTKKSVGSGMSNPRITIQEIRGIGGVFRYIHDVMQIQRTLKRAIAEGVISHSVKPAANLWRQECKKIGKEALRLDADGCYYLFHVHAADQPNPSAQSIVLHALINDGDFGCVQLEPILAATESLIAWAQENPATKPADPQNGLDTIDQPPELTGEKSEIEDNSGNSQRFVFRPDGIGFYIAGFGESGHVGNLKGFRQIYRLIQAPSKPVPMLELVEAADDQHIIADQRSKQPVLDNETKKQAAEELRNLMTERDTAKKNNDFALQQQLQANIDNLCSRIKADSGVGGQSRDLNSELEKLRPTIWGSLKRAFKKLGESHPPMTELAKHFELSISSESGAFIYRPAGNAPDWSLEKPTKK